MARRGTAWPGEAGLGRARRGRERGMARHGEAGRGKAGQGGAGQGKAGNGARHGKARPGLARQGFPTFNSLPKEGEKMKARTYEVTLTGETPLLMHNDNLMWSEVMRKWGMDPANKKGSVAGDDRSPAFRWMGNAYVDGGKLVIPSDNLMTVLREGGKRCNTGKGQQTFKAQTQSGIIVDQVAWPVEVGSAGKKGTIEWAPIKAQLIDEEDFEKHMEVAASAGFTLFVKRAKIGMAKHVRVRPRFDSWSCSGTLTVLDDQITTDVLKNILTFAGAYAGVGDWRPSAPKSPGSFGKFTATVKEAK